jgi:hypothetical protein
VPVKLSSMTPERWGQLEELYQAARALPPSERTALLERADPELRAEVASILAQEDIPGNGAFLSRPAWERRESLLKHASDGAAGITTADSMALVTPGTQLGPYKIEGSLGKGGMGQVFRARDTRLGREVAIKVSSARFSDRFEREARAISALNHPHICTLHDVGPNYLSRNSPPLPGARPVFSIAWVGDGNELQSACTSLSLKFC